MSEYNYYDSSLPPIQRSYTPNQSTPQSSQRSKSHKLPANVAVHLEKTSAVSSIPQYQFRYVPDSNPDSSTYTGNPTARIAPGQLKNTAAPIPPNAPTNIPLDRSAPGFINRRHNLQLTRPPQQYTAWPTQQINPPKSHKKASGSNVRTSTRASISKAPQGLLQPLPTSAGIMSMPTATMNELNASAMALHTSGSNSSIPGVDASGELSRAVGALVQFLTNPLLCTLFATADAQASANSNALTYEGDAAPSPTAGAVVVDAEAVWTFLQSLPVPYAETIAYVHALNAARMSFPSFAALARHVCAQHAKLTNLPAAERALAQVTDADRKAVLDYLTSPACALFDTAEYVQASALQLSRLLVAGGGLADTLTVLEQLSAQGRAFQDVDTLVFAVQGARTYQDALEGVAREALILLQDGNSQLVKDGFVTGDEAWALVHSGGAGVDTVAHLRTLLAAGASFASVDELADAVSECHRAWVAQKKLYYLSDYSLAISEAHRQDMLVFLATTAAALFPEAQTLTVTGAELDALLTQGRGVEACKDHLRELLAAGVRCKTIGEAIAGVMQRHSQLRNTLQAYLSGPGRVLLAGSRVTVHEVDQLLALSRAGPRTVEYLQLLVGEGHEFQSVRELGVCIREAHMRQTHKHMQQRVDTLEYLFSAECRLLDGNARTTGVSDVCVKRLFDEGGDDTRLLLEALDRAGRRFASLEALSIAVGQERRDLHAHKREVHAHLVSSQCSLFKGCHVVDEGFRGAGLLSAQPPALVLKTGGVRGQLATQSSAATTGTVIVNDGSVSRLLRDGGAGTHTLHVLWELGARGNTFQSMSQLTAAVRTAKGDVARMRGTAREVLRTWVGSDKCRLPLASVNDADVDALLAATEAPPSHQAHAAVCYLSRLQRYHGVRDVKQLCTLIGEERRAAMQHACELADYLRNNTVKHAALVTLTEAAELMTRSGAGNDAMRYVQALHEWSEGSGEAVCAPSASRMHEMDVLTLQGVVAREHEVFLQAYARVEALLKHVIGLPPAAEQDATVPAAEPTEASMVPVDDFLVAQCELYLAAAYAPLALDDPIAFARALTAAGPADAAASLPASLLSTPVPQPVLATPLTIATLAFPASPALLAHVRPIFAPQCLAQLAASPAAIAMLLDKCPCPALLPFLLTLLLTHDVHIASVDALQQHINTLARAITARRAALLHAHTECLATHGPFAIATLATPSALAALPLHSTACVLIATGCSPLSTACVLAPQPSDALANAKTTSVRYADLHEFLVAAGASHARARDMALALVCFLREHLPAFFTPSSPLLSHFAALPHAPSLVQLFHTHPALYARAMDVALALPESVPVSALLAWLSPRLAEGAALPGLPCDSWASLTQALLALADVLVATQYTHTHEIVAFLSRPGCSLLRSLASVTQQDVARLLSAARNDPAACVQALELLDSMEDGAEDASTGAPVVDKSDLDSVCAAVEALLAVDDGTVVALQQWSQVHAHRLATPLSRADALAVAQRASSVCCTQLGWVLPLLTHAHDMLQVSASELACADATLRCSATLSLQELSDLVLAVCVLTEQYRQRAALITYAWLCSLPPPAPTIEPFPLFTPAAVLSKRALSWAQGVSAVELLAHLHTPLVLPAHARIDAEAGPTSPTATTPASEDGNTLPTNVPAARAPSLFDLSLPLHPCALFRTAPAVTRRVTPRQVYHLLSHAALPLAPAKLDPQRMFAHTGTVGKDPALAHFQHLAVPDEEETCTEATAPLIPSAPVSTTSALSLLSLTSSALALHHLAHLSQQGHRVHSLHSLALSLRAHHSHYATSAAQLHAHLHSRACTLVQSPPSLSDCFSAVFSLYAAHSIYGYSSPLSDLHVHLWGLQAGGHTFPDVFACMQALLAQAEGAATRTRAQVASVRALLVDFQFDQEALSDEAIAAAAPAVQATVVLAPVSAGSAATAGPSPNTISVAVESERAQPAEEGVVSAADLPAAVLDAAHAVTDNDADALVVAARAHASARRTSAAKPSARRTSDIFSQAAFPLALPSQLLLSLQALTPSLPALQAALTCVVREHGAVFSSLFELVQAVATFTCQFQVQVARAHAFLLANTAIVASREELLERAMVAGTGLDTLHAITTVVARVHEDSPDARLSDLGALLQMAAQEAHVFRRCYAALHAFLASPECRLLSTAAPDVIAALSPSSVRQLLFMLARACPAFSTRVLVHKGKTYAVSREVGRMWLLAAAMARAQSAGVNGSSLEALAQALTPFIQAAEAAVGPGVGRLGYMGVDTTADDVRAAHAAANGAVGDLHVALEHAYNMFVARRAAEATDADSGSLEKPTPAVEPVAASEGDVSALQLPASLSEEANMVVDDVDLLNPAPLAATVAATVATRPTTVLRVLQLLLDASADLRAADVAMQAVPTLPTHGPTTPTPASPVAADAASPIAPGAVPTHFAGPPPEANPLAQMMAQRRAIDPYAEEESGLTAAERTAAEITELQAFLESPEAVTLFPPSNAEACVLEVARECGLHQPFVVVDGEQYPLHPAATSLVHQLPEDMFPLTSVHLSTLYYNTGCLSHAVPTLRSLTTRNAAAVANLHALSVQLAQQSVDIEEIEALARTLPPAQNADGVYSDQAALVATELECALAARAHTLSLLRDATQPVYSASMEELVAAMQDARAAERKQGECSLRVKMASVRDQHATYRMYVDIPGGIDQCLRALVQQAKKRFYAPTAAQTQGKTVPVASAAPSHPSIPVAAVPTFTEAVLAQLDITGLAQYLTQPGVTLLCSPAGVCVGTLELQAMAAIGKGPDRALWHLHSLQTRGVMCNTVPELLFHLALEGERHSARKHQLLTHLYQTRDLFTPRGLATVTAQDCEAIVGTCALHGVPDAGVAVVRQAAEAVRGAGKVLETATELVAMARQLIPSYAVSTRAAQAHAQRMAARAERREEKLGLALVREVLAECVQRPVTEADAAALIEVAGGVSAACVGLRELRGCVDGGVALELVHYMARQHAGAEWLCSVQGERIDAPLPAIPDGAAVAVVSGLLDDCVQAWVPLQAHLLALLQRGDTQLGLFTATNTAIVKIKEMLAQPPADTAPAASPNVPQTPHPTPASPTSPNNGRASPAAALSPLPTSPSTHTHAHTLESALELVGMASFSSLPVTVPAVVQLWTASFAGSLTPWLLAALAHLRLRYLVSLALAPEGPTASATTPSEPCPSFASLPSLASFLRAATAAIHSAQARHNAVHTATQRTIAALATSSLVDAGIEAWLALFRDPQFDVLSPSISGALVVLSSADLALLHHAATTLPAVRAAEIYALCAGATHDDVPTVPIASLCQFRWPAQHAPQPVRAAKDAMPPMARNVTTIAARAVQLAQRGESPDPVAFAACLLALLRARGVTITCLPELLCVLYTVAHVGLAPVVPLAAAKPSTDELAAVEAYVEAEYGVAQLVSVVQERLLTLTSTATPSASAMLPLYSLPALLAVPRACYLFSIDATALPRTQEVRSRSMLTMRLSVSIPSAHAVSVTALAPHASVLTTLVSSGTPESPLDALAREPLEDKDAFLRRVWTHWRSYGVELSSQALEHGACTLMVPYCEDTLRAAVLANASATHAHASTTMLLRVAIDGPDADEVVEAVVDLSAAVLDALDGHESQLPLVPRRGASASTAGTLVLALTLPASLDALTPPMPLPGVSLAQCVPVTVTPVDVAQPGVRVLLHSLAPTPSAAAPTQKTAPSAALAAALQVLPPTLTGANFAALPDDVLIASLPPAGARTLWLPRDTFVLATLAHKDTALAYAVIDTRMAAQPHAVPFLLPSLADTYHSAHACIALAPLPRSVLPAVSPLVPLALPAPLASPLLLTLFAQADPLSPAPVASPLAAQWADVASLAGQLLTPAALHDLVLLAASYTSIHTTAPPEPRSAVPSPTAAAADASAPAAVPKSCLLRAVDAVLLSHLLLASPSLSTLAQVLLHIIDAGVGPFASLLELKTAVSHVSVRTVLQTVFDSAHARTSMQAAAKVYHKLCGQRAVAPATTTSTAPAGSRPGVVGTRPRSHASSAFADAEEEPSLLLCARAIDAITAQALVQAAGGFTGLSRALHWLLAHARDVLAPWTQPAERSGYGSNNASTAPAVSYKREHVLAVCTALTHTHGLCALLAQLRHVLTQGVLSLAAAKTVYAHMLAEAPQLYLGTPPTLQDMVGLAAIIGNPHRSYTSHASASDSRPPTPPTEDAMPASPAAMTPFRAPAQHAKQYANAHEKTVVSLLCSQLTVLNARMQTVYSWAELLELVAEDVRTHAVTAATDMQQVRELREWIMLNSQAAQGMATGKDKEALRAAGVLVNTHTHKNIGVGLSNMGYELNNSTAIASILQRTGSAKAAAVRINTWVSSISQSHANSYHSHIAALQQSLRFAQTVKLDLLTHAVVHDHATTDPNAAPVLMTDARDFPKALTEVAECIKTENAILRRACVMGTLILGHRAQCSLVAESDRDIPCTVPQRDLDALLGVEVDGEEYKKQHRNKKQPPVELRLCCSPADVYALAIRTGTGSHITHFLTKLAQEQIVNPDSRPPVRHVQELAPAIDELVRVMRH